MVSLLAAAGCGDQRATGPEKSGPPYSAQQLRTAYGVAKLIDSGSCNGPCDGSGETVAVFSAGRFDAVDVAKFSEALAPPLLTVSVLGDGGWSVDDGGAAEDGDPGRVEGELDVESIHAIAPGARIHVYEFPGAATTTNPDELSGDFVRFVDEVLRNDESVASISFGLCESSYTDTQRRETSLAFREARDAGISVFAASGDSGAKCTNDNVTLSPEGEAVYPASDPYVTSVGATALSLGEGSRYGDEGAWDEDERHASGGMFSRYFPRPLWQAGRGVPPLCCSDERSRIHCDPCRLVPDVAANGSRHTSLQYCIERACTGGRGGASVAAPLWAGFAAIFDQYADAHRLARLGLAAPRLYGLARDRWPDGLHDVRHLERRSTGADLWASPGPYWDKASGLGSFDACTLVQELVPPAAGPACGGSKAGRRVEPRPATTASTQAAPSPSAAHEIVGRVEDNKFDCVLDSANDVSVADENGTIIGVAEMGPLQGPKRDCYEEFVIHDVPDASFYKFEESGIVVATYSKAQLEALGWKIPPLYQT